MSGFMPGPSYSQVSRCVTQAWRLKDPGGRASQTKLSLNHHPLVALLYADTRLINNHFCSPEGGVILSKSQHKPEKKREEYKKSLFISLLKSLCVLTLEVTLLKSLQGWITLQIAQVTLNPRQEGLGTF